MLSLVPDFLAAGIGVFGLAVLSGIYVWLRKQDTRIWLYEEDQAKARKKRKLLKREEEVKKIMMKMRGPTRPPMGL